MTPEEYEAAFHGIDLPETLALDKGVTIADVRAFVAAEVEILRTTSSTRIKDLVHYRLDLVLRLVTKTE